MSAPATSAWRVEQQVKSGMGTLAWLPIGEPFTDHAMATAAANRIEARTHLVTRVMEVLISLPETAQ